ncbi:hypothetical protein Tcan_02682 [Toxocara canis]|uniref:Uncharacterized protein n=1 Tax=Toxocara canis TaxID=6265 RepID=A0A0B2VYB3_TOXCA|nr:hypothetical protein Tcan_02682 [Toxocara canis]
MRNNSCFSHSFLFQLLGTAIKNFSHLDGTIDQSNMGRSHRIIITRKHVPIGISNTDAVISWNFLPDYVVGAHPYCCYFRSPSEVASEQHDVQTP